MMPVEGIDLLSPDTGVKQGRARMVLNADIHRDGTITRREGRTRITQGADFHSIRNTAAGLLVGKGQSLVRMDPATTAPTLLGNLGDYGPFDFTEYNGKVYVLTARNGVFVLLQDGTPVRCGVALPDTLPDITASETGALPAGRYAVALTKTSLEGEESPAAVLGTVELPNGGGIKLTNLETDLDAQYRVYLTAPDGQVLRLSEEFYAGFSEYVVTRYPDGAACNTQSLKPLPGGTFIRGYKGRLLIAAGDIVWHSEAMRQHLHDPTGGFTRFNGPIRLLEPAQDGVYVGDSAGVWFLAGNDITQAQMIKVSSAQAIAGTAINVPGSLARRNDITGDLVVWLSSEGYVLASQGGQAVALHADRVRIDPSITGSSALVFKDGAARLITMTGAGSAFGFGLANRSDNDA